MEILLETLGDDMRENNEKLGDSEKKKRSKYAKISGDTERRL